jgi:hemolysin activation/secretion protein
VNRQIKNILNSLFLGLTFASGYFAENLLSYAIPNPQPEEVKQTSPTRQIEQVQLIGNTVLTPKDLAPILQPIQGKAIAPEQVEDVANAITQLYVSKGYITSQALFDPNDPQSIVNGIAKIRAIEGQIERIDILGNTHTNSDYVRSRVELGITKPFNANSVEEQLRLLRGDQLFRKVTSNITPGTTTGKSLLIVQVEENNQFGGYINFDNYSPVAVGSERIGANLTYRNLTGLGDLLAIFYYRSNTGGSNLYDFSYSIPVNPTNGNIAIRYAPSNYKITDPNFEVFDIRGSNALYDISYRQPLIRSTREEFALSLGFVHQTGQTFLFQDIPSPFGTGPDANGVSTTSVFRFGQDYTLRDNDGAWAMRSQFNLGTGLFGATFVTIPNAGFFSWLGQVQRVQVLSPDAILIASLNSQLSANPLLPSQQFTLGGTDTVRGFRQNVLTGDNGIRLSLETRLTAIRDDKSKRSILQLAPFIDIGTVWNNPSNPTILPSSTFLASGGLGIIVEPIEKLLLRFDLAIPFVNLQNRGTNLQDVSIYFNTIYHF